MTEALKQPAFTFSQCAAANSVRVPYEGTVVSKGPADTLIRAQDIMETGENDIRRIMITTVIVFLVN